MHNPPNAGEKTPLRERAGATTTAREGAEHSVDAFTLDAAFDVVPDWIALIDAECTIRRANRAMAAAFGLEPDDLVGRACYELVHGTDGPVVQCPHLRLLNDSGEPTSERVEIAGKGFFDVSCAPLRDAEGTLVGSVHLAHDASLPVRTEEESRESANYLQQMLDAIPTPIFHKDAAGVYVAVNRAFADAVGRDREDILGKSSFDVYPDDMASDYQIHDAHLLAHGRQDVRVAEELYADGERRLVELHRSVYADLAGRPAGIVGVEFDVTERERAEAALRRAEASLERAQQMGGMGSWVWEAPQEAFIWSDELYRIWGVDHSFSPDPASLMALVHPDDHETVLAARDRLWGGAESVELEFRIVRPDGVVRIVHESAESECTPDGAPRRAFGIMQDITDGAEAAEALREQARFYRSILDAIPAPVFEKSPEGVYREANRAMADYLGLPREGIVGHTVRDVAPADKAEAYHSADLDLLQAGGKQVYETEVVGAGTETRRVEFRKATYDDASGDVAGMVGVMLDVTQLRRAESALHEQTALLQGLFDTMPSGCGVYEVHGTGRSGSDYVIRDFNETSLRIEGRRKEDVVGKSLKDLRPNIDEYGLIDVFWRVWRTGDPERFPAKVYTDARYANWYDNYVFKLPTGEIVAIYNDVTAEKRAEEALHASEAEMHAVFDLVGIPMFVMDTRGAFTRWNRAFGRALGYPAEELQGMTIREVTPPKERAEMLRRLSVAMEGEGSCYRLERRFVHKDGSLPWFDLSVTPVVGADGDVIALIGAGTDITAARAAKEALVAREGQLREALGETVAAMGAIVALRDPYTAGHERRVAALVEAIASDMGLAPDVVDGLRHAASVHDVGKVAVPAEILSMPRRLSEWEYSLVQTHVEVGHEVLSSIAFEQPVAEIVAQHHERLDGSGYPRGLEDGEITLGARILAVADVVEAMASHRPYRPALGVGAALDEIQWGSGRLYDESVVASCVRVVRRGLVDLSEPGV